MSIFNALPIILQNGTLADAAQVMADFNKIIADGNANAAANGANADITSLSALTSPIPLAGGSSSHFIGSTSTGSAAAQVVSTLTPTNWSLTTGFMVSFNPGFSSTGATTLNVGGTGALAIRKPSATGPVALQPNDIVSGQNATVVYDGTAYLLINEPIDPLFGVLTTLASAATTDLGTVLSHNINVTGTTTITSFGSSADAANPIYLLRFAGILQLTHSASLVLPTGAPITTAAGDACIAQYFGGGVWQVVSYQRQNGQALATPSGTSSVLVGIQVFTASGTYTPNAAANTAFAIVTGSGGAGGGVSSGTANTGGGGGGAGTTTIAYLSSVSTLSVTIGATASGSAGAGNNGAQSSLGTITAPGGSGGAAANNGTGTGGSGGGAGSGGVVTIPGGNGGGGTSSAAGSGGPSFWGGGGAGQNTAANRTGVTAPAYGAGGGGCSENTVSQTLNGGAGGAGIVVVFEFK